MKAIWKTKEPSRATPLCTIVDGYDPVGNRLTRNLDGNPITWSYDDLYRLTGQQKAGQVCTYTLDGVGNLKTMWEGGNFPKTFTFNAADRLATMVEGASLTTYAWTGYGALESEITGNQTTGYAYNGQDQLAVVTAPSGDKTTYSFDGDGLRRSVATTNVNQDPPTLDVTTMVWDGSDYLLLNEPTQNRVVLTLDSEIVSCGSKDLLTDPLGSLVKEISTGASLGSLVELYPYGTRASALTKISIPFVYIAAYGYYNDSADRDYVRARELYKKLGRWMQTDPMWPEERAFEYCEGSPVSYLDPFGAQRAQPSQWNDPPFRYSNNCYSFACDRMSPWTGAPDKPQPGGPGCLTCEEDVCSCRKVMDCVARDNYLKPRPSGSKCPPGTYTVILFVKPTPPCDYHFIRNLPNGRWCDKHGWSEVCEPFDNPYEHAKRKGYSVVCQHYCAPVKSRR